MNLLSKDKANHRNITPNFIIIRNSSHNKINKNSYKNYYNQKSQDNNLRIQRSQSKGSKCSFQAYERRILHLKSNLNHKDRSQNDSFKINIINKNDDIKRPVSNTSRRHTPQSKNNVQRTDRFKQSPYKQTLSRKNSVNNQSSLSRKKYINSNKNIFRPSSRSNTKRNQLSLQKQQMRAKIANIQLINNLKNNQPNFIGKLKMKKTQRRKGRQKQHFNQKSTTINYKQNIKKSILNLNIQIKGPQALKQYQIYGQLGKGAYGTVKMGIYKPTSQKVAIKFYPKSSLDKTNRINNLQRQINILSKLNNKIIARLLDAIQTQSDIYLILQYGGANSLYNYLLSKPQHRLSQSQAKCFFITIVETIYYLHERNIVHRDIKAQNILINRFKQLKLIDFGFSIKTMTNQTIDTFCGTPTYMAPQIVSKIDHIPRYTDLWSLGVLLFVMLQGNYPFRSRNQNQLFQKIRKGKFQYIHHDISNQSKKLIQGLMNINPYKRLTCQQILGQQWKSYFSNAKIDD